MTELTTIAMDWEELRMTKEFVLNPSRTVNTTSNTNMIKKTKKSKKFFASNAKKDITLITKKLAKKMLLPLFLNSLFSYSAFSLL